MYEIGQAVSIAYEEERRLGTVAGVNSAFGELYYDVSLEEIVVKAVEESSIQSVGTDELRALSTRLLGQPSTSARDALLRMQYITSISQALASAQQESEDVSKGLLHSWMNKSVVVTQDDCSELGTVRGILLKEGTPQFDVEIMGEMRRVDEQCLSLLSMADTGEGLVLGGRARFVASGYEDDESFVGTICLVRNTEEGIRYSLMFDDGDILEDLSSADLTVWPH